MHFFGTLGTLSFLSGFLITIWVIGEKIYHIYRNHPGVREVTDQPLFFLALVALVVGVQLFLAGFLAEMMVMNNSKKREYLVIDRIGTEVK